MASLATAIRNQSETACKIPNLITPPPPTVAHTSETVEQYSDRTFFKGLKNIRREIKDKSHSYRIGPAPVTDAAKSKQKITMAPGSLDSDLEDIDDDISTPNGQSNGIATSRAGCHGLITYFAKLGSSDTEQKIDLEFVDSLLRGGADINFPDRHGQTCMHEIARGWHTDVAQFALTRGADIDRADKYGRTPLHLAAAVNYAEMVSWLVTNGAKISATTKGEIQTAMHYSAKNNAVDSLKILYHLDADINDRDFKSRTPLFVAAETGRSEACRFLLEQGAPVGVYDDSGTCALTLMIEKMPDVAKIALGQFETVDKALRKKYYYLNYLENDIWKRIATKKGNSLRQSYAKTPLETICLYNEHDLIMHPVILHLIDIKWKIYGKFNTALNTCLNLIYTLLWTILGVTLPSHRNDGGHVHYSRFHNGTDGTDLKYYIPIKDNIWRMVLETLGLVMAFYFVVTQVLEFRRMQHRNAQYKEWKRNEILRDIQYCHARWPEERRYLNSEIDLMRSSAKNYLRHGWNILELLTNVVMAIVLLTRIGAILKPDQMWDNIHYKVFTIFLIMLWLRFMRSCQCYQSLGPLITMLSHVMTDTLKFIFLFLEVFIPYVCAFWILFGGNPETEFEHLNDVIYQVFLMTLVDEYQRDYMLREDKVMAQLLIGSYLAIASVVCINLYIALMSQTFIRIYQNAKATAFMEQSNHLLRIEQSLGRKQINRIKRFMHNECSPQVIYDTETGDCRRGEDDLKPAIYRMFHEVDEIKDRLLLLSVERTSGMTKNQYSNNNDQPIVDDETISKVDVVTQRCDLLNHQMEMFQKSLNEIKALIESKVLINKNELVTTSPYPMPEPYIENKIDESAIDIPINNHPTEVAQIDVLNKEDKEVCKNYQNPLPLYPKQRLCQMALLNDQNFRSLPRNIKKQEKEDVDRFGTYPKRSANHPSQQIPNKVGPEHKGGQKDNNDLEQRHFSNDLNDCRNYKDLICSTSRSNPKEDYKKRTLSLDSDRKPRARAKRQLKTKASEPGFHMSDEEEKHYKGNYRGSLEKRDNGPSLSRYTHDKKNNDKRTRSRERVRGCNKSKQHSNSNNDKNNGNYVLESDVFSGSENNDGGAQENSHLKKRRYDFQKRQSSDVVGYNEKTRRRLHSKREQYEIRKFNEYGTSSEGESGDEMLDASGTL